MAETPTYKMTEARPANYWMSSYAIYIQLNAAGDYNYIHANCSSGSVIMCHVDGINELSYDSGHNYRRWQLTASPTVFHDNVARYVYIAIPKSAAADAMAVVVFPSEKIDIYGKNAKGEQVGSTDCYYIFTQGIISDSYSDGGSHARTWTQEIDTGILASDEALASGGEGKWWDYNSSADTVKFLKAISEAIINKLTSAWASIKQLVLNGHLINGVSSSSTPVDSDDTLVTPKYGETKWLSKTHDDTADGQITFGKGFISKEWGIFNQGWKTGSYDGNTVYDHGAMVDKDGHGVFQSLFARGFISAPKFVFNEINVTMAEQWNTNAFGTIESVDTQTRQITLHLEENDYGSVSVGDICRGIFADLGDTYQSDSNVEGALDDCNFVVHRGFFTTYFTVEKIITNGKGHCVFQYRKRTKTTPDPCAYMDFAQYGSFTDNTRQSSMYLSSRGHSFIEVLDGVDNWEIQPQNRVARYGWLGDLVVQHDDGTKETLKGNGLFAQNHVYFGGDIIKLSNISDLDDLQKMAGAYDVSLSRYQGVVTVDDMGNVIGGIYTLSDMPQADGSTKKVKQWRLSTAVFVRKGQDILLEEDETSEQVTEGHYRVTAFGDGCECEIANSTVYITSIKNLHDGEADTEEEINYDEMRKMERCRVSIVVELEGKTSKTVEFPIRIAHDALPFLDCDLDNEHASVAWNTKAKKYIGFPVKSVATLLYHNNPWQIDKDSHVDGLPDGLKADISFADKKMVISITTDGKKTGDFLAKKEGDATVTTYNLSIHIIGTYAGARYEYSKLLTIDRRADTTVYEIIPSSDSIIMDKDKTLSVNTLSCEVWATSSDDKRYKVDDLAAAGLEMKYCKGDGTPDLAFGTSVSVTKDDKSLTLGLFNKTTGELLDKETVPVVAWGEDGKGVEFIYFRSKDAQTVLDNFKPDEWFADPNYQGGSGAEYVGEIQKKYPGWTDDPQGVDSTHPYEYVSVRKSVNGVWGKFSSPAIYATMARSIKGVNTFYAIVAQDKAGQKPSDSEFTHDDLTDVVIKDNKGKWLWSADKVEYYDSSASVLLNKTCLGACEELANVTEQYGVSSDPSAQPSAPYDASGAYPSNLKEGDCIWSRDHIVWLNNTTSDTDWQFIGRIGKDGRSITGSTIKYARSSDGKNHPATSSTLWQNNMPSLDDDNPCLWIWTRYTYSKAPFTEDVFSVSKMGIDGNGVEYIYYRCKDAQSVQSAYHPSVWARDAKYQTKDGTEFVPTKDGWTDNPQGVSATYPYEYVSVRVRGKNGKWGNFSAPAVAFSYPRSILNINTYYAIADAGETPNDIAFTYDVLSSVIISSNNGKMVWSADKVTYGNGDSSQSTTEFQNKTCLGACKDMANVTEQYGVSSDPSVQPSAPYDASGAYPTNLKEGNCIWSRDHIVWLNNSSSNTDWQFIGKIGVDGDGVTSTEIAYGSSTSDQNLPTSWYSSQSQVTINDTYCWFWTRTIWHYKKSAAKTAYTKSYKGKNGTPATYYEARFSEQRAAVYVEQGFETGYVGVKFSGSFYLVEGDNASKASGSGLGLRFEFLNEAGTAIVSHDIAANGSSFSYSSRDIQSDYRNKGADKITSCRYTVICNDGRDTKSGVIPIGFNAGSVFYQTEDRFESLLQESNGYSELTQTANGIFTHVQRLETNMLMGTTTGVGWTKEVTSDASYFSFNEAARQFDLVNYYPAFRSGFEEKGTSYSTLKSPIVRIEKNKKYIISFCMTTNSKVSFSIGIRFGTASECSSGARYFTWNNNVEPDDKSNKQEGVIYRSKSDSSRYFVIIETNTSSYEYMQVLFINAVVVSKKDDIPIDPISMSVSKIQMESAVRDEIADIEPSPYKESQNVIESYIKQTADSIELHASKIIFKGETVINDKFIVDDYGNVTLNDLTANNATINGTFVAGEGNGKIVITSNKNYGQLSLSNYVWLGYSGVSSITGSDTINMKSSYGGLLAIMSKANIDYYGTNSDGIYLTAITGMGIDTEYANIRRAHIDRSVFGVAGGSSLYGEVEKSLKDNLTTYLFMSNPNEITLPMPANPENGNTLIVVQLGAKINFKSDFGFRHGTDTASVVNSNSKGTWTCFVFFNQKWHTSWFNGRPW